MWQALLCIGITLTLAGGVDVGAVLRVHSGSHPGALYGYAVEGLGDLDGDGAADYAVSERYAGAGLVEIRSGRDGSLAGTLVPNSGEGAWGTSLALLDDLDGDGYRDLAVGGPETESFFGSALPGSSVGAIRVYSGKWLAWLLDGRQGLAPLNVVHEYVLDEDPPPNQLGILGTTVADVGDVDGDGVSDFAARSPVGPDAGATVYSGRTGVVLLSLSSPFRQAIAEGIGPAGDVDDDGLADVLVVASEGGSGTQQVGPVRLEIYSGADGARIRDRKTGLLAGSPSYPAPVGRLDDLDGDGLRDLVVGAGNEVVAYSAGTAKAIYRHDVTLGFDPSRRVSALEVVPDANRDGFRDILYGIHLIAGVNYGWGDLVLLSGKDGALLGRVDALQSPLGFQGAGIAALGQVDGDAVPDVLVGGIGTTSSYPAGSQGEAALLSGEFLRRLARNAEGPRAARSALAADE